MRRIAAVATAKLAAGLSRRLRFGGGTALPGLVAQRIDPDIVRGLAGRLGRGNLIVTGTNGKTTTARLLASIARAAGVETVANRAGSNMMRGIASALVEATAWNGGVRAAHRKLGIFEVDEATLPQAAWAVRPRVVVFTNLFRDQLDRYGEVEYVARVWRDAVSAWPDVVTLVLNADDPAVASLGKQARGRVVYYGIADTSSGSTTIEHAADARWCPGCGAELSCSTVFYGHLGHWSCPGCGNSRPAPEVSVAALRSGPQTSDLTLTYAGREMNVQIPLTGLYNAYNVAAAVAGAVAAGFDATAVQRGLASFKAAFGRQERLRVNGRHVQVLLAKNPAGLNQVLRTITDTADGRLNLVFFLNDGIADGRDISWIWDVDFELLSDKVAAVTASGRRAWDMALRLKYAGLEPALQVESEAAQALRTALRATPPDGVLYVVPTYTAMLQVRDLLARWAGGGAFWEEAPGG